MHKIKNKEVGRLSGAVIFAKEFIKKGIRKVKTIQQMNYLAHAYLSFGHPEILAGNMMGDFVKGRKILASFPSGIKEGILLHRKIDSYTDRHPATLKAKNIFRPAYRLYSGAFVDSLYDHFLANDPRYFQSAPDLFQFTTDTYQKLSGQSACFPESFKRVFRHMEQENWLFHYRTLKGLQQSFGGLVRRAKYLDDWQAAYALFICHYYELNQLYFDFIEDIIRYVKNELNTFTTCPTP